jgi:type IV secretory pathway VirB2 component (pilin)
MLPVLTTAAYSQGSGSLSDPAGSSAIVAAVAWLQATLLGTIATTIAIVAVAAVGLMMLTGRVNLRHGLIVIAGSFILFGASAIVAGIQGSTGGVGLAAAPAAPPVAPPPALPPPRPANSDPYAGASVPAR